MSKSGKQSPAKLEPGKPAEPATRELTVLRLPDFDPAPVAEVLCIYRHNKKDGAYFIRAKDGEYLALSWREVLKLTRGMFRTKPQDGELFSEADVLQAHIIEHRRVDFVLDGLAGHQPGCHQFQGTRVLATKAPTIIEPLEGDFSTIQQFIHSLLPRAEDGVEQWILFCAWLKRAIEAVRAGKPSQGQILILAGSRGDGKSRLQEFIITPGLGGRSADPIAHLTNETQFNSECFGAEHLLSGDPASSMKKDDRAKFKQRLKQISVGDWQRYHEKGRPAVMLPPVWRLSISINLSPDDLALLPAGTSDFSEKVIMLQTAPASNLPGPSEEERAAFREAIARELPAFIDFLLHRFDCLIPVELRDNRFGVRSYEHPAIRAALHEERPEIQLLEFLDIAKPWCQSDKGHWCGKWHALQAILQDDPEISDEFARWLKHNPLIRNLSRLADETKPPVAGRVGHGRSGKIGGVWKIYPPDAN